jgi:regulator of protease activity HflC (stomatin/prohibitin superfamily)
LLASPVGAYAYAGWERAWVAGLLSAIILAFIVGGTLYSPSEGDFSDFVRGGLWSLAPVVFAIVMMFAAATQVLVVWRCGDRDQVWRLMAGLLSRGFGRFQSLLPGSSAPFPIQVVSKGEVTYSSPPSKSFRMLGPGVIIVESGNALVLENTGKVTRVVGSGFVKTQPYEAIFAIVDLRLQKKILTPTTEIFTKDGIPLQVSCTVLYRIHVDEIALVKSGKYAIHEEALRRATLSAADWREQTELDVRTVLYDTIAGFSFEQICDPRGLHSGGTLAPRITLQQRVQQEADRRARIWGVRVLRVTIDEIKVPEPIKQRMLERWDIDWRYIVDLSRAITNGEVTQLDAVTQQRVAEIKRETSEIEAMITAIEARAKAEAVVLEKRGAAIAEAERFQRVLGAIQDIAGREKMGELTQELIRVLTSVNDTQAIIRILGASRPPMLARPEDRSVGDQLLNHALDEGG